MTRLPGIAALSLLLAGCGEGPWDPPPPGARRIPPFDTGSRQYEIERRLEPGGIVRAITLIQAPPPANNSQGYSGWEVHCDDVYRLRRTGKGTLEDVRAGRIPAVHQTPGNVVVDETLADWFCG